MPRGKRNKKSVSATLGKAHTKPAVVLDGVPAAPGYDHVNGLVLKTEPGLNGETSHHPVYENEQSLERAIDELINGNDDTRAPSQYGSAVNTAGAQYQHVAAGAAVSTADFRLNGGPRGADCPLVGAVRKANASPSPSGEFGSYLPAGDPAAVVGDQRTSPVHHAGAFSTGSDGAPYTHTVTTSSNNAAASGTEEDLDDKRALVNGAGGAVPVRGGAVVAGTASGAVVAPVAPGTVGSNGGVVLDQNNMPTHWQLTPVGRGRVASSVNAEKNVRPAAPERIPTGFNERPPGDVPQSLLTGDKNPVSALNEFGQKRGMEVRIEVVSQSGPPHNPSFCMAAFVGGRQFPVVESSNKKDGRREAAEAALRVLATSGANWTKNNWPTTDQTTDPASPSGHQVAVRTTVAAAAAQPTVAVIQQQDTKPAIKSSAGLSWQGKNPVSALYEYGQARGQHVCIEVIEQSGPPHNPRFLMAAFMGSHQFPAVEATNKKDGRTEAAVSALRSLSQGGDAVVLASGAAVAGAGTESVSQLSEKTNGEALPQVALPVEDEVAAQSKNPISVLNEYGQTKGVTVKFDVLNQSGPPHNPRFTIAAYVGDRQFDPVEASNKKEGKRQAAETALKTLVSEGECSEWARYANGESSSEGSEGSELNQPDDGGAQQQNQEQQSVHVSAEEFAALHKNPVSALNEYGQGKGLEVRIDVLSQRGPPHNPRFTIAASLGGRRFQSVVCTNKKDGRREAADVALRTLMAEGQYKVAQGLNQGSSNSGAMDNLGHFDKMAALAHRAFNTLAVTIPDSLSGRKVLAAMIMKTSEDDDGRVISLGTGNRCITGPQMSQEGATVNDSHAEVIARRGFLRFVYQNLLENDPGTEESIFSEEKNSSGKLKLKEFISFHLYISTAPCGDGALFSPSDASSAGVDQNVDGGEHNPTFTTGVQGLLRTKMEAGEGTIPVEQDFAGQTWDGIMHGERLRTMSCSDKICRWNILGLQGALLSHYIETIYLTSLTLGYMYNHGHLTRAVCCRLEKAGKHITTNLPDKFHVNHPGLGRVTMYDPPRETEKTKPISINWVLKDITPEVTDGSKGQVKGRPGSDMVSQIAKSSLYKLFKEVAKKYTKEDCVKNTYHASKQAASDYQKAKAIMCQCFRFGGCGEWVKKPLEQDMFY